MQIMLRLVSWSQEQAYCVSLVLSGVLNRDYFMHSSFAKSSCQPFQLLASLQEQAAVGNLHWHPPAICQPNEQPWEPGLAMYCLQMQRLSHLAFPDFLRQDCWQDSGVAMDGRGRQLSTTKFCSSQSSVSNLNADLSALEEKALYRAHLRSKIIV